MASHRRGADEGQGRAPQMAQSPGVFRSQFRRQAHLSRSARLRLPLGHHLGSRRLLRPLLARREFHAGQIGAQGLLPDRRHQRSRGGADQEARAGQEALHDVSRLHRRPLAPDGARGDDPEIHPALQQGLGRAAPPALREADRARLDRARHRAAAAHHRLSRQCRHLVGQAHARAAPDPGPQDGDPRGDDRHHGPGHRPRDPGAQGQRRIREHRYRLSERQRRLARDHDAARL